MNSTLIQIMKFIAMQGAILGIYLFFKKKNVLANKTLAVHTLSVSFIIFSIANYLGKTNSVGSFVYILILSGPLLCASLYYCYTLVSVKNDKHLLFKYLIAIAPFFIEFTQLIVRYYFLSGSGSGDIYADIRKLVFLGFRRDLNLFLPIITALFYVGTYLNLKKYKKKIKNYYSDTAKINFKWLQIIFCVSLVNFSFDISFKVLNYFDIYMFDKYLMSMAIVLMTYISLIWYVALYKQKVFTVAADAIKIVQEKIEKKVSTEECFQQKLTAIVNHVESSKAYLNPEYTIKDLADEILIPVHKISKVLNSLLNKNFYNFINEYRIEAAKKALLADCDKAIIRVAFDCGFNSKSTFNEIFKKYCGVTPTMYRKNNLKLFRANNISNIFINNSKIKSLY